MVDARMLECRWPHLPPPYDAALRDSVSYAFEVAEPVAIIATGTIVRGTAQASSDLDVYLIHVAPFRRRIQRFFRGVPAEIFINPPHAVRSYFREEHSDGRPLTAHMLATGVVIWQSDHTVDELRTEAVEWLGRRSDFSADDLLRARYGAASRLEDGVDMLGLDSPSASMLLTLAVVNMLEIECRKRSGRIPRGKDLLTTIAELDPELGALAKAFFTSGSDDERQHCAQSIADRTIEARGFFAWDSGLEPFPDLASR
jgi:hypothetical protein